MPSNPENGTTDSPRRSRRNPGSANSTPRREPPSPARSTASNRTPRRESATSPTASVASNGTPSRRGAPSPSRSTASHRTPRRESTSPTAGVASNRTPRRVPPSPARSVASNRTPRRGQVTPRSVSSIDTPMRWGTHRSVGGGEPMEVGSSPTHSVPPTSPSTALMSEIDLSSPLNYGTPSSLGSIRTPRSGIRGTPIRMRPDVRSDKRIRQVNVAGDNALEPIPESQDSDSTTPHLVIWGTNVSVAECKEKFKQFILRFIDPNAEEDERSEEMNLNEPLYLQKLEEIHTLEEPFLNINCAHLETFDPSLYKQLICYPQEVIPTFDMTVNEMFYERYPAAVLEHQIQVRPFNAEKTRNMRALNPEDIDQLITISGMVIRTSNLMPEMREAFFKCIVCQFCTTVEIDRGRITEPTLCSSCNTNFCFSLIHNRSQFTDKQMIKLQESPDDMPAGQTPHTVILFAHNDLVESVQPGDRVTVTGIYRAQPLQVNPRMRNLRSVYKTHMDVLHFRKIDTKRLYQEEQGKDHRFSPERIELLHNLSQKPDVYERLARAVAPSIYKNDEVKKGILLQMFGGTRKTCTVAERTNFRAEINILLCGEPGTAKSQFLQYIYNLVPRSQYTSGKGSSAVGLTAYITKDPDTRQLVLQTGALVLADNGICCIDEFDKMNHTTRSVLHEVMEQQTLSIAKAGIICQLNARTSILAAANPAESQWNHNKNSAENVQLPPSLLSRFDLIFIILDPKDETFDRRLGRHLISLYYNMRESQEDEVVDMSILRDYIAYAKEHFHPKINDEAAQKLVQCYVKMRKLGSARGQISAYPRQLESLIRMAEAHARVRFSQVVEVQDVVEADRLYIEALKQFATDPITGKIDMNILVTGLSSAAKKRKMELTQSIKKLIESKRAPTVSYQKLFDELKEGSSVMITRDQFEDCLKDLQDDGLIVMLGRTSIRINSNRD